MVPLALFTEDWRQITCLSGDRTVITDLMCGQSQDFDWNGHLKTVTFGTRRKWKLNRTELDGSRNAHVPVARLCRWPAGGPRARTFIFGLCVVPTNVTEKNKKNARASIDSLFILILKYLRYTICNYWELFVIK